MIARGLLGLSARVLSGAKVGHEQRNTIGGTTYTLRFTYDDRGNMSSATDRTGSRTDYTYDARGDVLTGVEPAVSSDRRIV